MSIDYNSYKETIKNQIDDVQSDLILLRADYESAPDDIIKSQIKTFIEKKELLLVKLMGEYHGNTI